MVHSLPVMNLSHSHHCGFAVHFACILSHGDEKDFLSTYTAWCQVYNSRLTFLYLLYILGIFRYAH